MIKIQAVLLVLTRVVCASSGMRGTPRKESLPSIILYSRAAHILATTSGWMGEKLPESAGVDSFDFSPIFLGESVKSPVRRTAIYPTGRGKFAMRQDERKFCMTTRSTRNGNDLVLPESAFELYTLKDDPSESTDLFAEHPERATQLREFLLELVKNGRSR